MKMRSVLVSSLVAVVLASAAPPSMASGNAERNKALVRRVFEEILNGEKYEVFEKIYTKDFVKHVDRHNSSLAEEIEDARSMKTASSDMVMTIDKMIAERDLVVVLYTGRGTSTGPFSGMPATGKTYVVTGMTLYRLSKGRIAEEWTFYNMLDILNQFGYRADALTAPGQGRP